MTLLELGLNTLAECTAASEVAKPFSGACYRLILEVDIEEKSNYFHQHSSTIGKDRRVP